MKRVLTVIFAGIFLGAVPIAAAQMHGGSGGTGQGQSGVGGMQGQHSQTGMADTGQNGPRLTPAQHRQLMHTTQTQDKKYATCAQAMNKVRDNIRHMGGGTTTAQPADAQQRDNQLDSDVQDLQQDQNDFLDSLSDNQKTALENQIKDVQNKMKQLDALSKELKAELEDKNADPAKIRAQAKRLDKLSKAIQNEQRLIATALGIQS